ncbi:MAG: hypothetical protein IH614_08740, partial [Desulfuromonadales bacterium]|nr:hypothetical protein [Desulfuromonadales bacterium]
MMHRPIRRQLLVPLSLTFLVLACTFLYSGYTLRQRQVASELEHRNLGVQMLFEELLAGRSKAITTAVELIARDPRLQKAMAEGDRAALLEAARPIYHRLA